MPEQEFELYLSLLTRFLRLDPAQREQIADELRDHFEERFEELAAEGLSREEAIRATLDEFGDAAGLAAHFSHIGNRRRRRTIMRCTLTTAAGLAATIFLATTFWPDAPAPHGPARAVAQSAPQDVAVALKAEGKAPDASAVEGKLDQRLPPLDFEETPLPDAIAFIADQIQVDILFSKQAIEELGVRDEAPITLHVKHAAVTARTALELVLEQISGELGYTVRDGLVYITRKHDTDEIQVYNVRDLLKASPAAQAMSGLGRMGGRMPMSGIGEGGEGSGSFGGMPGGIGGGGMAAALDPGDSLLGVIESTVFPDTWSSLGGSGSLAQFNGLLIVKQSQTVHREIKQLLDRMREVDRHDVPARRQ